MALLLLFGAGDTTNAVPANAIVDINGTPIVDFNLTFIISSV